MSRYAKLTTWLVGAWFVVSLAASGQSNVIDPHGIPTSAMTVLPLSLIPTFGVPLFLILHVICIAQALRWPAKQTQPVTQQRWSEAH